MQKYLLPLFLLCFRLSTVQAQQVESIHVHFDKDIYLPGETVWFKAYLYYRNRPSYISTNFYIGMYDEAGMLLQQKQFPVLDGTCAGDFVIPDTVQAQTIRFRAFTKGLLLAGPERFYERTLMVYQKGKQFPLLPASPGEITLRFFPESGKGIAGFQNLVAVKATYPGGEPAKLTGVIVDGTSVIDSFFTDDAGLGSVAFTPENGKMYQAIWKDRSGSEKTTMIDLQLASGVLLHVETSNNLLFCNIQKSDIGIQYNTLHLSLYWGGEEIYQVSADMSTASQWVTKIPLDSLPEGIITVLLLDEGKNVLRRRPFLNFPGNGMNSKQPKLRIVSRDLGPKGLNTIEMEIPDSSLFDLSVSVADLAFYDTGSRPSINGDLWFGGNSRVGFGKPGNKKNADLGILTREGRTDGSVDELTRPLDNYLSLNAFYKNKEGQLLNRDKKDLVLVIQDSIREKQFIAMPVSPFPGAVKDGFIFYDSAQVHYKLDKSEYNSANVAVSRPDGFNVPQQIPALSYEQELKRPVSNYTAVEIDTGFVQPGRKRFNEVQTIKEVTVRTRYIDPERKRIQQLDERYTSGMFSGLTRGFQLNVLDDNAASINGDFCNYVISRLPSLRICSGLAYRFLMDTKGGGDGKPCAPDKKILVFLNEVELPDQQGLEMIQLSNVAYIKFISGIVIGSSFTTPVGAMYVYTKKGEDESGVLITGMQKTKLKGYDLPHNFTSPVYADKVDLLRSDVRTTLYWNPNVFSGRANNRFKIEFNNNDLSRRLLLVVEGFNEEGRLVHIEKVIE